jgi:sugar lactone lactonase YvrE
MNNDRFDASFSAWLSEGPDRGPASGLERALSATYAVDQRGAWRFPSSWLPRSISGVGLGAPRALGIGALLLLTLLLLLAMVAVYIGSRPRPPTTLGPAADRLVAFQDGAAIYVSRPDGSGRRPISDGVGFPRSPVFSPDGTRVAFVSAATATDLGGTPYVALVDGSAAPIAVGRGVRVRPDVHNVLSWSPDGTRIAYASDATGVSTIVVAAADGSGVTQMTDDSMDRDLPSWSPWADWEWIAYRTAEPDGQRSRLEMVRPDGSELEQVTMVIGPGSELSRLDWRPTGFGERFMDSYEQSYAANWGFGTKSRVVMNLGFQEAYEPWTDGVSAPNSVGIPWSPDGQWVAILTESDGVVLAEFDPPNSSVYEEATYDGELRHLGEVVDCWVDWAPDATAIYGGSPDGCETTVVVPLEDPEAAFALPGSGPGAASWQPLGP